MVLRLRLRFFHVVVCDSPLLQYTPTADHHRQLHGCGAQTHYRAHPVPFKQSTSESVPGLGGLAYCIIYKH